MYQGTLENMPDELRSRAWDIVYLSHVFEHLADPRTAAKAIWDLLADGGTVFVEVPNQFESWLSRCGNLLRDLAGKRRPSTLYSIHHRSFFSIRHLERIFVSEGFEVVSTSWTPKRFDSPIHVVGSVIEWMSESLAKQGSNIQLVATRPIQDS